MSTYLIAGNTLANFPPHFSVGIRSPPPWCSPRGDHRELIVKDIGFHHIIEQQGVGIAVTGMLIVFFSFLLVSLFIALLPKILGALPVELRPEPEPSTAVTTATDNEIAAAIGFVLHQRRTQQQATK